MERPGTSPERRLSGLALIAVLTITLLVALMTGSPGHQPVPGTPLRAAATPASPTEEPPGPLDPSWPDRLTFLSDSVGLGSVDALREAMSDWHVQVLGEPALMLDDAAAQLVADGRQLNNVVVVALGYNSLWRRNREDYDYFAAKFDREADRLLRVIRTLGGQKIVWVTLREAKRPFIPRDALDQHRTYAWYFPYVNERLDRLAARNPDVVLADWAAISNRPGITYDAIHLDPDGAFLYSRTVKHAVLREPFAPSS
jgi:hypothetical protein